MYKQLSKNMDTI